MCARIHCYYSFYFFFFLLFAELYLLYVYGCILDWKSTREKNGKYESRQILFYPFFFIYFDEYKVSYIYAFCRISCWKKCDWSIFRCVSLFVFELELTIGISSYDKYSNHRTILDWLRLFTYKYHIFHELQLNDFNKLYLKLKRLSFNLNLLPLLRQGSILGIRY